MPNSEGEKLHEPIIWRQRLPEGTDPAQLGGCCGISASPHCRCRHRSGAHLGVQQGSGAPHWEHWTEQLAASLPACARSCAMCAEPGSPARRARSALPPCEPLPSHPLEIKLSALPGMKSRAVVAVKTIQQAGWYILELR